MQECVSDQPLRDAPRLPGFVCVIAIPENVNGEVVTLTDFLAGRLEVSAADDDLHRGGQLRRTLQQFDEPISESLVDREGTLRARLMESHVHVRAEFGFGAEDRVFLGEFFAEPGIALYGSKVRRSGVDGDEEFTQRRKSVGFLDVADLLGMLAKIVIVEASFRIGPG